MKKIKGLWFPDAEHGGWLDKVEEVNGLPVYQSEAMEALIGAARGRKLAIDGGAHVGLWTLHLARVFDHVVAFEPNPAAFECLERNLDDFKLRSKVTTIRAALGRFPGKAILHGSDEKSLSWSLRERPGLPTREVNLTSIDNELAWQFGHADAIKLDVEGFQYDALLGAAQILLACRPVVLLEEKHDDPAWRASELLKQIGMKSIGRWKRDFLFVWSKRLAVPPKSSSPANVG